MPLSYDPDIKALREKDLLYFCTRKVASIYSRICWTKILHGMILMVFRGGESNFKQKSIVGGWTIARIVVVLRNIDLLGLEYTVRHLKAPFCNQAELWIFPAYVTTLKFSWLFKIFGWLMIIFYDVKCIFKFVYCRFGLSDYLVVFEWLSCS